MNGAKANAHDSRRPPERRVRVRVRLSPERSRNCAGRPWPNASYAPCAYKHRAPSRQTLHWRLRHTPPAFRESDSSAAVRDDIDRRAFPSRIVAIPVHFARSLIRKAGGGTVDLHEGGAFRSNTALMRTWTHAMTIQTAIGTGLKQETIAIVAVGLTILGTILYTTSRLETRLEARIDRIQAETRAEARADREIFTREILRLTSEQSRLAGIVEGARTE